MKKTFAIFIVFLFLCNYGFAQHCYGENLVPNPSLDEYSICPNNGWQIDYAVPWTQPLRKSASTALNQCMFYDNPTYMDTAYLRNFPWRSLGMAYLIIWAEDNWRVYIEVPLVYPLSPNRCYYAEFYVIPLEFSYKTIDAIGIYFSDTLVKLDNDTIIGSDTFNLIKPIYTVPQISNPSGNVIGDPTKWTKVSGTFTANGTETAMIVGNFIPSNEIHWEILNNSSMYSSWYFFDDFLVCACEDTVPPKGNCYIPNVFSPNGDGNNDVLFIRGEYITQVDFKLYNRWGNLVFESQDQSLGWDGRQYGQDCPEGVYFFTVTVSYLNGAVESKKGNVTILR